MQTSDPNLRAALQLQRYTQKRGLLRRPMAFDRLLHSCQDLVQSVARLQKAHRHGWNHAADQLWQDSIASTFRLQATATELLHQPQHPPTGASPPLRDLLADLHQLHEEFESVTLDLRGKTIRALTEPITLEGIHLGAFQITLSLPKLTEHSDVSAFQIDALHPNPPSSCDDVIHPHVKDGLLCAGDATVPLGAALREGRICDAFLAIRAVLNHYNPSSPYVSLESWEGLPCADCGSLIDEEEQSTCACCHQTFCLDCSGACGICESSCCRSCLDEDPESNRTCCSHCYERCSHCGRTVEADLWIESTRLCPGCHEEAVQEKNEIEPEETNEYNDPEDESIPKAPSDIDPDLLPPGLAQAADVFTY